MQLYNYQTEYLEGLPSRYIFSADLGTGKTIMALAHYKKHGSGRPLLILAPASKVRTGDWDREITEYFGEGNEPRYEIYSYDKFSFNPSVKQFQAGKRALWHKYAPQYDGEQWAVIADEVHFIKSPQSNRSKAVYWAARNADFFIGLSGTALPNGWIDFAGYSKIFGFTSGITEFKKKYCNIQTYKGFPEIVGYFYEDKLKMQWNSISKPLSREQAVDLPERVFYDVKFRRPNKYIKYILDRVNDSGEVLDNPSKLLHALRQLTTPEKLPYISDMLAGTDDNIVIFYNYESELLALKELIAKKHKNKTVFEQNGHKHEIPTKEQWPHVTNSVTLAHYKSGSTGVEMQYANITVFMSPTYSFADYSQSIGRTHRNGQTKKTIFYRFKTIGTIENDVYECLDNKKDFQEKVWYDNVLDTQE